MRHFVKFHFMNSKVMKEEILYRRFRRVDIQYIYMHIYIYVYCRERQEIKMKKREEGEKESMVLG